MSRNANLATESSMATPKVRQRNFHKQSKSKHTHIFYLVIKLKKKTYHIIPVEKLILIKVYFHIIKTIISGGLMIN